MMSDVPWGVLLSGGLDSSLVASVAQRFLKKKVAAGAGQWMSALHSFSVGLVGSPDLAAAAKAAAHIGTIHHPYTFTLQEGLDAVAEVVHHLETYDVTTIRAATPMFLMARKIKAMGVKMVLSGEGADEILAGYLYFHKAPDGAAKEGEIPNFKGSDLGHFPLAPDAGELFAELKDKVKQLYIYDCLRANKSTMAWGVEARVPFLDADFLKEQFSDGVGYGWIDALRDHAEAHVSDHQFSVAPHRFAYNTPRTKEAYYYRQIFDSLYPSLARPDHPEGKSIACSTERALKWDASFEGRADQSGRSVGVHVAAYDASFDADADTKKAVGPGDVCIHAAASGRIAKLRGVALSAPAVEPDPEMATPLLVFLARKLSNALPKLQLDPLPSKYLSRDATVIEQYLNDPSSTPAASARASARRCSTRWRPADLAQRECRGVPLLLLHGTGDRVIDPGGSTRLCDAWAGPTQLELLPGEFHEIFNEPGRERAYGLLVDWLGATLLA
ncbi:hypothetical protein JL721_3703 [Aureococcus anophagefferens]|nr:hypothetical protein JL721_3703 [Aureococcus anophagefferens]